MVFVKKQDSAVNFGGNHSNIGQSEWEMMTFNEEHRCVFPLVPNACDCAKLNEYFWKIGGCVNRSSASAGDFGENLSVRKVARSNRRTRRKMGSSKLAIQK